MFNNLTNFGLKRTSNQAIGFYIVYLVAIVVISMVVAFAIPGTGDFDKDFLAGARIGNMIAFVGCVVLGFLVASNKKMLNSTGIVLILLAGVLSYFAGGLLGLIPVAYLTTK